MRVTWLGHSSVKIDVGDKTIYIDPFAGDYDAPADLVLCTHGHFDHSAVDKVKKKEGCEVFTAGCEKDFGWCKVSSVPAYNIDKFRSPGKPFHPKGEGVGYIIEAEGRRIYHAGDTDFIPEMRGLGRIDCAFLPIGGIYTMDVEEAKKAQDAIKAEMVVPMHYNSLPAVAKYGKVPWSEARQARENEPITFS